MYNMQILLAFRQAEGFRRFGHFRTNSRDCMLTKAKIKKWSFTGFKLNPQITYNTHRTYNFDSLT